LNEDQRSNEARATWAEALTLFKRDFYSLAWLRYNLGASCMRDLEINEAERHFLEGKRLSVSPKSFSMRSGILSGLANVCKARGEWPRAEFAYHEALETATDAFDRVFALTGLTRTLLLAGRAPEAFETLVMNLNPEDTNDPNILITRALVHLRLSDQARVKEALEAITVPVLGTYQWLHRIAQAEFLRREEQSEQAVELLKGLPVQTLHAREEVRQFPKLFKLVQSAGFPTPEPLEYVNGLNIQVQARGLLHIRVNNRTVSIPPTGRTGELLVFILEQYGGASLDSILDAFYPDAVSPPERARARKAIWGHANALREALGWRNAIKALGRAYELDPDAVWSYDIRLARKAGSFSGEFLKGIYSEWALEVGRELEALSADSESKQKQYLN
jgi:tetratricopeptide (TPR) repeat protein